MKHFCLIISILSLSAQICAGQSLSISIDDYLQKVYDNNINYAIEKLNINIAEAAIISAKTFSDPSLSVEYGYNQDKVLMMGQGVSGEFSKTFTFGKREAAINLATSEKALSEALLADFLRNLRAEAASSFYYALYQKKVFDIQQDAYENISRLAQSDSLRFAIGDISEIDAIQSNLEAGIAKNEVRQASIDAYNASIEMGLLLSDSVQTNVFGPTGEMAVPAETLPLDQLIMLALRNRADLMAAMQNVDVSQKALTSIKRNRRTDVDLSIGVNYNTRVRNEEAPAPPYTGITAGLSIPLKFSNINKGEIKIGEYRILQAEKQLQAIELQVRSEVMMAYNNYLTNISKLQEYDGGLLDKALVVIDSKTSAYNRGNCSLLEVLNAQRTYDQIRLHYTETLYLVCTALVQLQQAVGL